MEITLENIMHRVSVRSFTGTPLDVAHCSLLERLFAESVEGCPYGYKPRFGLVGTEGIVGSASSDVENGKPLRIGTYGIIQKAPAFMVGAVKMGPRALVDYGYALEGVILAATSTGLGTCWLGGTFSRSAAAASLGLAEGEVLPAISPVGYPADRRTFSDKTVRFLAGSDRRLSWPELFFDQEEGKSLTEAKAGKWAPVLEAVRRGPSASNKQPWRILALDGDRFQLLFAEDRAYNRALGIPIQELDMGIALRHFESAAKALGLDGHWLAAKLGAVHCDAPKEKASRHREALTCIAEWVPGK